MLRIKNHQISGSLGRSILLDVYWSSSGSSKPLIIFVHGFKGFKDWGAWGLMADQWARSGYVVLCFNFSHNGTRPDAPLDFVDLEAFGRNSYTMELDDLGMVIDYVNSTDLLAASGCDLSEIYLVGHSRGGGIVLLKASQDRRISKVVSLAGVADFGSRFPKGSDLEQWRAEGVYYIYNGRTKQQMPRYYQIYEDFEASKERLDISAAVRKLEIPMLLIHGMEDQVVSAEESQRLSELNTRSQLELIQGAGHTFGSSHPWAIADLPTHLRIATDRMMRFFQT